MGPKSGRWEMDMDHERRGLLLATALASVAFNVRGSAVAAESGLPSGVPKPSAGPPSDESVIALDARVEAPGSADARLCYGGPSQGDPRSGLVIRVKKDSPVKVRLANNLSEPTTVDWHGMRLPSALAFPNGLKGAPLASDPIYRYYADPRR